MRKGHLCSKFRGTFIMQIQKTFHFRQEMDERNYLTQEKAIGIKFLLSDNRFRDIKDSSFQLNCL